MTRQHSAWTTLGIAPTDDIRTIRTAYARLLKTLDPDTDPQAVIALREARDMAMFLVQHGTQEQPEPAEPIDTGPVWEERPAAEVHAGQLQAMLHAERDSATPFATPAEREAMLAHWQVIAADPRLEEIGFFAQFEQWATGLIAYNTPLSDPLIIPATELFGWTASDDTIAQSREVAHISYRYGWLHYLEAVQQPGHSRHPAWTELTTPAGLHPKRGRVTPVHVTELLGAVRSMRPDLESRFDARRVALWERMEPTREVSGEGYESRTSSGGFPFAGGIVIAAIAVIRLLGSWSSTPPPPAYEYQAPEPRRMVQPPPMIPPNQIVPDQNAPPEISPEVREILRKLQEDRQRGLIILPPDNASR